ncbi:MAG: hypothetical protein HGB32_03000 [Geobacteraceae bacterium]|nr:hypothetical protein [Geobacteraceae bacterium]NTW79101.1 hypothetical protein [Geobacteraceae bacterium]
MNVTTNTESLKESTAADLAISLATVSAGCTQCGLCVEECRFLQRYGTPKKIADSFDPSQKELLVMPYECSLCGLCTAVCPEPVDPDAMFLEMRREAVRRGNNQFFEYGGLLGYERKGVSRRFSWYGLPTGCDTIFFPGCALPGTRPAQTRTVFETLQSSIPALGIVFDCCTKPSHDLGRQEYFNAMFGEMSDYLVGRGVKTVLVACPNCYKMFSEYSPDLSVRTIYEALLESGAGDIATVTGTVTIHDPCVIRSFERPQDSVRALVVGTGLTIEEMPHNRQTTLCCGEGGAVACLEPEFADDWGKKRKREAIGRRTVTYCAGCTHMLGAHTPTSHVVDLLTDPAATIAGKAKVSKAPFTYLNRLKLKKHFMNTLKTASSRERIFNGGEEPGKRGFLKPLIIFTFLVAAIMAIRMSGVGQYLEQEKLRSLIAGYGVLAPAIYMLVYTVAPALFLPGLPISIVGGVLFGPFWGVIYTIVGATAGACVAFLVARYMARGWVAGKLSSPRWRKLDKEVEKNGWKVVAFTRLIPLFPFNLLNYAFGLTSVKFSHYAMATFLFMLPATIAFITFSSSLLDLVRGKVSPTFLVGLVLMVLVSLLPMFYRRWSRKREEAAEKAARGEVDPPKTYSLSSSLKLKGIVLVAVALLGGAGVALVRHFFWALNAYLYTLEFNLLTVLGRLRDGDLTAAVDYLQAMSPLRGTFTLFFAHLAQGFWLPFSSRVFYGAVNTAFGFPGAIYGGVALLATALVGLGLGRFFLGDIRPIMRLGRGEAPLAPPVNSFALVPLLAAIPWLPLSIAAVVAGGLRIPVGRAMAGFVVAIVLRIVCITLFGL